VRTAFQGGAVFDMAEYAATGVKVGTGFRGRLDLDEAFIDPIDAISAIDHFCPSCRGEVRRGARRDGFLLRRGVPALFRPLPDTHPALLSCRFRAIPK